MPGIDALIAKQLSDEIKKSLDKKTLRQLERRLFSKYGLSIKQSISDFEKFDVVLKEFLGSQTKEFEKKCINQIYTSDDTKKNKYILIKINNQNLVRTILNCCADDETIKILNQSLKKNLTIHEIITKTKIPKSSVYRKIEKLIRSGILLKTKKTISTGKRVEKYHPVFDKFTIIFDAQNITVQALVDKKIFLSSSTINPQKRF